MLLADLGEYPSFAHFSVVGCGGALIAKDIVLTAAHCEVPVGASVCIGVNRCDCTDAAETFLAAEVLTHPNYVDTGESLENDVMLVRLNGESSLPLWKWNSDSNKPLDGETVTVIGCGVTSFGGNSPFNLFEVSLNTEDCQDSLCRVHAVRR